ncbi:winged helix-turn-helix domain-containing protein [Streptomyces sp. NPDC059680]|uniref:winged helix-turn-helix domain-containing protein n=1 Tax=Streptomyces sp. NPDC059680 TaxID=3346904 RepID=UPI0036B2B60B
MAKDLRVSVRSVQRWRRTWNEGGPRALRSQGPASLPRLSQKQFTQLEADLAKGPAAHGWEDQRWTLARIKTLIGRRFHLAYTIQGVRKLLVRNGWSWQVPARRAMERDRRPPTACAEAHECAPGQWAVQAHRRPRMNRTAPAGVPLTSDRAGAR